MYQDPCPHPNLLRVAPGRPEGPKRRQAKKAELADRYELGMELNRGQYGVVHICFDKATGKALACKTIRNEMVNMSELRREVDIMRKLPEHNNIVKLEDAFEDDQQVHIVMELCTGRELYHRVVEQGYFTECAARAIFRPIVEVVQFCHDHGVMHRDLKPENFLFVDRDTSVIKLIDFGLATFLEHGQVFTEMVGSPEYLAPEVIEGKYGPEADIWSTGVILYVMLCGATPFWAVSQEGILEAILEGSAIDLETEPWDEVSNDAKDLIKKMLNRDPGKRLTAKEVLHHPWLRRSRRAT